MSEPISTKAGKPIERAQPSSEARASLPSEEIRPVPTPTTFAQSLGNGIQKAAKAAAQVGPRRYLGIGLRCIGFGLFFVTCQTIGAVGLREMYADVVSTRLSSACPLLCAWMADYEETRKLDLANVIAAGLLLFSYGSWEAVIYRIVHRSHEALAERYLFLVPALGLMIIDTILFAIGIYVNGSFTSPIPAAMLAIAYDLVLVLFSVAIVKLEKRRDS